MYKWPWSEMTWPQGTEQTVAGLKSSKGSLVQGEPGEEGRGRRKQDFLGQVKNLFFCFIIMETFLVERGFLDLAIQLAAFESCIPV